MPADLSRSASNRSFVTKPKAALDTEKISSQITLSPRGEPDNTTPANAAEAKPNVEGSRIVLLIAPSRLAYALKAVNFINSLLLYLV
jgi:hypothetical protein